MRTGGEGKGVARGVEDPTEEELVRGGARADAAEVILHEKETARLDISRLQFPKWLLRRLLSLASVGSNFAKASLA